MAQVTTEQMVAALKYWGWVRINDQWFMRCSCAECNNAGRETHYTIAGLSTENAVKLSQTNQYWFFNERGNMEELI